jgi:hypothetical protein
MKPPHAEMAEFQLDLVKASFGWASFISTLLYCLLPTTSRKDL